MRWRARTLTVLGVGKGTRFARESREDDPSILRRAYASSCG